MAKRFPIWWILCLLSLVGVNAVVTDQLDPYVVTVLIYAGINIILASSLNLINGFAGQFSMGHAGFMAVGAYSSAMFSIYLRDLNPEIVNGGALETILFAGTLI